MNISESLQWCYATKKFDYKFSLCSEQIHILEESFNLTTTSFGL